jgi:hypothetical protein
VSSAPFAHGKAFLPIEPVDAVDTRWLTTLVRSTAFVFLGRPGLPTTGGHSL